MRHVLLGAILLWPALASAGDLGKADRTVKKEPAYKGEPKYCLLVFGPEAKTKVWLVLDGDILYVDRNGDGDLTEAGERVGTVEGEKGGCRLGRIGDAGGPRYEAELRRVAKSPGRDYHVVGVEVRGHRQAALAPFADRPQDAPVLHLNGPLTLGLAADFHRGGETGG